MLVLLAEVLQLLLLLRSSGVDSDVKGTDGTEGVAGVDGVEEWLCCWSSRGGVATRAASKEVMPPLW